MVGGYGVLPVRADRHVGHAGVQRVDPNPKLQPNLPVVRSVTVRHRRTGSGDRSARSCRCAAVAEMPLKAQKYPTTTQLRTPGIAQRVRKRKNETPKESNDLHRST
jgi:hypothetical protein